MTRSVDKCRRSLRKRAHFRSVCCTCSVVAGMMFIAFRVLSWNSSREEKEYNILLNTLKKVKGIGKSSLLYVDKSEYIFADEQPDTSEIRNIIAKQPTIIASSNATRTTTTVDNKVNKNDKKSDDNSLTSEHDPSIEENAVPETFKWHINVERSTKCTPDNPAKHVVLLRSHRTGSHTIGNLFYRYGDLNNLFFALPKAADFQHYWPLRFHHTRVDKGLLGKEPPNFLINTARNSRIKIKTFVSSETYKIAIMRDPVTHLQSVFETANIPQLMKQPLASHGGEDFKRFARDPGLYIEEITNKTNQFEPVFYLLHNGQLFDFGYNVEDYTQETGIDLRFVLHELDEYLDLVLINEYMDESLVLLQRMLCWQLSDIAYIKKRVRRKHIDITQHEKVQIREWNKYDNMLYNHFNKSLWEKLSKQDENFWNDVKKLKTMNGNLQTECINVTDDGNTDMGESKSKLNGTRDSSLSAEIDPVLKADIAPNIKHICERLLLSEKEYVHFLKLKQKEILLQDHRNGNEKLLFRNTTEGKFYYDFFNTMSTSKANKTSTTEEETPSEEAEEEITLGMSHTD